MLVKFGALVYSKDDKVVGTIDRLVLDPASGDLKVVAINVGLLLPHDVEAPASALETQADGGVRLSVRAAEVDSFPRFVEERYTSAGIPPVDPAARQATAILLPTGILVEQPFHEEPLVDIEAERQLAQMYSDQDLVNAVLADGSAIRSQDGRHVGALHALDFDPATGHLTRITLRHGRFMSELLDLPAALVAAVDDGVIHLRVTADWLHLWASLEPGMEVWTADRVCLGAITRRDVDALLVSQDGGHRPVRVPMTAVGRISQNRVLLTEDHARALLWMTEEAELSV